MGAKPLPEQTGRQRMTATAFGEEPCIAYRFDRAAPISASRYPYPDRW
jgi:hypothetical protein